MWVVVVLGALMVLQFLEQVELHLISELRRRDQIQVLLLEVVEVHKRVVVRQVQVVVDMELLQQVLH
jgi:hypothetical protein